VAQLGKFINAEFSWGRWNSDDARQLEEPLLAVLSRMSQWYLSPLYDEFLPLLDGLMSFVKYTARNVSNPAALDTDLVEKTSQSTGLTDTFLVQQMYKRNDDDERQNSLRLVDLLPLLREATFDLRSAASNALAAVRGTINFVNTTRWSWRSTTDVQVEQENQLDSAAERLRGALAKFRATGRLRFMEPFEPHLGTSAPPLRSLYVCYVFSASIVVVSEAILKVAETVREITSKRRKNRLWAPKGLRQLAHALFVEKSTDGDLRAYGETQEVTEVTPEGDEEKKYRLYQSRPFFADINSITFLQGVTQIADHQQM